MAVIYHPETQASVVVDEEAVSHYRRSGWVRVEEWRELEAQRAAEAAEAAKASASESADDATPPRPAQASTRAAAGKLASGDKEK